MLYVVPLPYECEVFTGEEREVALSKYLGAAPKYEWSGPYLIDVGVDPPTLDWPSYLLVLRGVAYSFGKETRRKMLWCCVPCPEEIPSTMLREAAEKVAKIYLPDPSEGWEEARSLLFFGVAHYVRDAERRLRAAVKEMQRAAEAARRKRMKEQATRLRRLMKAWLAALDEKPEEIKALIKAAKASSPSRRKKRLKAWRLLRRYLAPDLTLDDLLTWRQAWKKLKPQSATTATASLRWSRTATSARAAG